MDYRDKKFILKIGREAIFSRANIVYLLNVTRSIVSKNILELHIKNNSKEYINILDFCDIKCC